MARDLFATQGYDATSLRQVAEALDLTKAALYHHYDGKQALLLDIVEPILAATEQLLADVADTTWDDAARRDFLDRYVREVLVAHADVGRIIVGDPAVLAVPALATRATTLAADLAGVLAAGTSLEDQVRAAAAMGAANAVLQLGDADPDVVAGIAASAAHAALNAPAPVTA